MRPNTEDMARLWDMLDAARTAVEFLTSKDDDQIARAGTLVTLTFDLSGHGLVGGV